MDTGGSWKALELKSWGEWAASFHIEPGNQVRFRAFANDAWHESCWFSHPAGVAQCSTTPPPPPPPPPTNGTTVTFQHGGGNEWWVEAKVSPKPAQVHAIDDGGAWVALSFKDWGEWAGSFHIEQYHNVRFRATYADGSTALSCWFVHPQGNVYGSTDRSCRSNTTGSSPPTEVTWPREGSFVKYYVDEGDSWPGGADWYELNVTLRYQNGTWQQDVEGWNYFYLDDEPRVEEQTRIRYRATSEGPWILDPPDYAYENETTYTTKKNGAYVDAPAVRWNNEDPECPCGYDSWIVHDGTGLMLDYFFGGRMSHNSIEVVDTDAPIAPGDPAPTAPPAPAWPTEGSFASYEVHEWYNGSSFPSETHLSITYRYQEGDWTVTCVGTRTEWDVNGTNPVTTPVDETNDWSPDMPAGPLGIASGARVQVGHPTNCGTQEASWYEDTLLAKSKLKLNVTKDGEPFRASVWYADETDADEDAGLDYDRWWDLNTGLTLQWETRYDWPWTSIGTLTDTDAPLAAG
jgi:hypothetical protein